MARRCPHDRLTRAARFPSAQDASASRACPGVATWRAPRYKNPRPARLPPRLLPQKQAREDGDGGEAAPRRWGRGGGGHRAAAHRHPRARPLPPALLPRPVHVRSTLPVQLIDFDRLCCRGWINSLCFLCRQGGGCEPQVAQGGGAVAGVAPPAELRGAAHRRRHRRTPRPCRSQPPRPRHVSPRRRLSSLC
jgi:hypothetical protein